MSSSNAKNEHVLQAGPLEITIEILRWLDCPNLLSVRQTCKFLNDVSRMRALWVNLIAVQGTSLGEPLDSYTTEQLQFHVCKQVSATLHWRSDHPEPAHVKKVYIPPNDHMILIRGGRWLLVGFKTGAVIAYDLDSTDSREVTIVERGLFQHPISKFMVDMDDSAPWPSFKLAILFNSPEAPRVQIHRVSLVGHGDEAELAAIPIISIPIEERWHIGFASLRGEYFCRGSTIHAYPSYHDRVEVFKWRNCTKPGYPVSTIFPGTQGRLISGEILPGDQIMLLLHGYIAIYDLPEPQAEAATVPHMKVTQPRWKLPIEGRWGDSGYVRISTPQLGHLSSYTACTTLDGIYGIIVPLDPSENPEVAKLLDFTVGNGSSFAIGQETTFIRPVYKWFYAGYYSFKQPLHAVGFRAVARRVKLQWQAAKMSIVMDEQTGRVVVGSQGQKYVKVLNFAHEITRIQSSPSL